MSSLVCCTLLFFFTAPAPTEIYTLSLHDALPIFYWTMTDVFQRARALYVQRLRPYVMPWHLAIDIDEIRDRKSTRLNSSHLVISYAVFCLKKKKKQQNSKS